MSLEQTKIELEHKQDAREMPPVQVSPEAVKQEILEQSEKEVAGFRNDGQQRLESLDQRAVMEGLEIDTADKNELLSLNQEADMAKNELLTSIKDSSPMSGSKEEQEKKGQPKFMREFSKQQRSEMAESIKRKRQERRTRLEKEKGEARRLEDLKKELNELSGTAAKKFLNYFKIRKLKSEISIEEGARESKARMNFYDNADRASFNQNIQKKITDFFEYENRRWENAPHSKEDISNLFQEKHLASLPLNDYIQLLKRFPGEMVTHVTRQGVRDHTGHMWHTAGVDQYHNGFTSLIDDGRLRAHWSRHFEQYEKNEAVAKALRLGERYKTKEEALRYLEELTDTSGKIRHLESYADFNAVHVAAEEVADEFYGAERGNEIFFVFPSNQIASQYYFNGVLNKKEENRPNDQWIWTEENRGIDINSGIVFISKDAMVNPQTGSKYEIDENGRVVEDEQLKKIVEQLLSATDFKEFAKKALETLEEETGTKKEDLEKELEEKYGVIDEQLRKNLLKTNFLRKAVEKGDKFTLTGEERWLFYKRAESAITSEEFWENYFKSNPEKKPSKIVYYEGGDPTAALKNWQEENGLTKKEWREDMNFSERRKDKLSAEANEGVERFKSIAEEAINKFFETKEKDVAKKVDIETEEVGNRVETNEKENHQETEKMDKETIEQSARMANWVSRQLETGGINNGDDLIKRAEESLTESGVQLTATMFGGRDLDYIKNFIWGSLENKRKLEESELDQYRESLVTSDKERIEKMARISKWVQQQMENGGIHDGADLVQRARTTLTGSGVELTRSLFEGKNMDYISTFVEQSLENKRRLEERNENLDKAI